MLAVLLCFLTLSSRVPQVGPPFSDKVQHFIGFGFLALPLSLAYPRRAWAVVAAVAAFGGAIELIQPYVGRASEWADLLADTLGASTAAILARMLRR